MLLRRISFLYLATCVAIGPNFADFISIIPNVDLASAGPSFFNLQTLPPRPGAGFHPPKDPKAASLMKWAFLNLNTQTSDFFKWGEVVIPVLILSASGLGAFGYFWLAKGLAIAPWVAAKSVVLAAAPLGWLESPQAARESFSKGISLEEQQIIKDRAEAILEQTLIKIQILRRLAAALKISLHAQTLPQMANELKTAISTIDPYLMTFFLKSGIFQPTKLTVFNYAVDLLAESSLEIKSFPNRGLVGAPRAVQGTNSYFLGTGNLSGIYLISDFFDPNNVLYKHLAFAALFQAMRIAAGRDPHTEQALFKELLLPRFGEEAVLAFETAIQNSVAQSSFPQLSGRIDQIDALAAHLAQDYLDQRIVAFAIQKQWCTPERKNLILFAAKMFIRESLTAPTRQGQRGARVNLGTHLGSLGLNEDQTLEIARDLLSFADGEHYAELASYLLDIAEKYLRDPKNAFFGVRSVLTGDFHLTRQQIRHAFMHFKTYIGPEGSLRKPPERLGSAA